MNTTRPTHATEHANIIKRALSLTDAAWQAHAAGRVFEFRRVESSFEALIEAARSTNLNHAEEDDPVNASILRALASIGEVAKRNGSLKAFKALVKAAEPATNRSKCLDTSKR